MIIGQKKADSFGKIVDSRWVLYGVPLCHTAGSEEDRKDLELLYMSRFVEVGVPVIQGEDPTPPNIFLKAMFVQIG